MAAKPKTTTKRKSASVRVSKKKRGISKFQALAIAGVLALIGVVAVVASHASGTPNYQYSWNKYCVSAYGKDSAKDVQDCKNTSAEAMVYRLYNGLYAKKSPDEGGYKYWTQKLAGDRIKVSETSLVVDQVGKMGNDTAFVKALYKNMLLRDPSQKEVTQWVGRLKAQGNKKWSRQKVAIQFAISSEAIRRHQAEFNKYAADPKHTVTVVQTAAIKQKARWQSMRTDYMVPAAAKEKAAKDALNIAKAQLTAAGKTANKNALSASDLSSISGNQAAAARAYATAADAADTTARLQQNAQKLYNEAKDLADYATDIKDNRQYGMSEIGQRFREVKSSATSSKSYASSSKTRIADIAKKYSAAAKKFNDAQAKLTATENPGKTLDCAGQGINPSTGTCALPATADGRCDTIIYHGRDVVYNADKTKKTTITWDTKLLCDHGKPAGLKDVNRTEVTVNLPKKAAPTSHTPREPTTSQPAGTSHQCPNGFFSAKGKFDTQRACWSGDKAVTKPCPSGRVTYDVSGSGSSLAYICRRKMPIGNYVY